MAAKGPYGDAPPAAQRGARRRGSAIVTGAARGIGQAIALRLAREGHPVAIADVDLDAAETTSNVVNGEVAFKSIAVHLDVTDPDSVERMVVEVQAKLGPIEVLVNNAGIGGPARPLASYDPDDWRRVMAVNLDGVFYCCRAVIPLMVAQGYGRVVNVASIAGKEGNPNLGAYSASKGGVIALTKSIAKELATTGVIVNCVTPAVIETDMMRRLDEATLKYMVSRIPMGRTGRPDEVAALVSWLASEECSFTTGAVVDISGGRATY